VEDRPLPDAIAERTPYDRGVVGEARSGVAVGPAPFVYQGLRDVPMIEGRQRMDMRFEQRIDQPPVIVESFLIRRPLAAWLNTRPGDREAIGREFQRAQQRYVVAVAVVAVAGDIACGTVWGHAGSVREAVPDRLAPTVFSHRAFDLVGRSRG